MRQNEMNTVSNFPRALRVLHVFVIIALIVSLPSPRAMARPRGSTDCYSREVGAARPNGIHRGQYHRR